MHRWTSARRDTAIVLGVSLVRFVIEPEANGFTRGDFNASKRFEFLRANVTHRALISPRHIPRHRASIPSFLVVLNRIELTFRAEMTASARRPRLFGIRLSVICGNTQIPRDKQACQARKEATPRVRSRKYHKYGRRLAIYFDSRLCIKRRCSYIAVTVAI